MRRAEEMYNYCVLNDLGNNFGRFGKRHFRVIEDNLLSGEKVLFTFMGLHQYSLKGHKNQYAYAVTDKRIIMAQKNLLIGEKVQSIGLNEISNVSYKTRVAFHSGVTIKAYKEEFTVGTPNLKIAKNIYKKFQEILQRG